MKKCPFCAEEIQDQAIKCRYCGELLKKKNKLLGCLYSCLISLAILFLSAGIFIYFVASLFQKATHKLMAAGTNMPRVYSPLNPGDIQIIFSDMGESFRVIKEYLNNESLKEYQQINLKDEK